MKVIALQTLEGTSGPGCRRLSHINDVGGGHAIIAFSSVSVKLVREVVVSNGRVCVLMSLVIRMKKSNNFQL